MEDIIYIRAAKESDLSSILDIEEQSFDTEKFSFRRFRYLLNKSKSFFMVASIENQIAGYLILLKRKGAKSLRIYSLAIEPKYRGLGVAQKLIENAELIGRNENIEFLSLEVSESNIKAISLYKKSGFKEKRIILNYYNQGNHALALSKNISIQVNTEERCC